MTVRLIRAHDLYPGTPYADAAVAPPGSIVFTAGACPIDEAGLVADPGDYAAQAARAAANLRVALDAAGVSLADVLKTTVYVASGDQRDLVAVWDVVHAAFDPHEPPSTLLGVSVLGYSGQLVEIEAVALAGQPASQSLPG